jgi:hypothetical protein
MIVEFKHKNLAEAAIRKAELNIEKTLSLLKPKISF